MDLRINSRGEKAKCLSSAPHSITVAPSQSLRIGKTCASFDVSTSQIIQDHWSTMLNLRRIYRRAEESFSKCLFLKSPFCPFVTFRSGKRPNSALHNALRLPCIPSGVFVAMATP